MTLQDQLNQRAIRTPLGNPDVIWAAASSQRARRTRRIGIAAAAALLIAAVATALLAGNTDDTRDVATQSPATTPAAPTSDPPPTSTTETPPASPPPALLAAGPDGIHRVAANGTVEQLLDTPASIAYQAGALIVHQAARGTDVFPPRPDGPIKVWDGTTTRTLPPSGAAQLLDARLVDGAPTALVAERDDPGTGDPVERLVRVDLLDDTRTVVVERPARDGAHQAGALLDDGTVVGLYTVDASVFLAHWVGQSAQPAWETVVANDTTVTLARPVDDTVYVTAAAATPDGTYTVTATAYLTADGSQQLGPIDPVSFSSPALTTGLFCTVQNLPTGLVCSRADGPPVTITLKGTATTVEGIDTLPAGSTVAAA